MKCFTKKFRLFSLLMMVFLFSFQLMAAETEQAPAVYSSVVPGTGLLANDSIVIGTGTELSGNTPVTPWYGYSFTQTLYFKNELNIQDKIITRVGYHYGGSSPSLDLEIEIWMAHTTLTQLAGTVPLTTSTKVFDGPFVFYSGSAFSSVEISPFFYNNSDNLLITVIEKKPGWNSSSDKFWATTVPSGQSLCLGDWNDSTPYDPEALPAGNNIGYRANIKLWFSDIPTGPPVSQITPLQLDFGDVELNGNKIMNIAVKNTGAGFLEITGYNSTNDAFTVVGVDFPLNIGVFETKIIEIQFSPTVAQMETGEITFLMDEAITGDKQVGVMGMGVNLVGVIIGTETTTSSLIPISPYYGYSFSQTIYLQSEINVPNRRINRIGFHYAGEAPALTEVTEIWIAHTTLTELTTTVQLDGSTKVYDGAFTFYSGDEFSWVDVNPFFYNNTDNLLITVIEKKPGWNSSSDMFYVTDLEPGQPSMTRYARNDSNPYDPNNLPAGSPVGSRANIKIWLGDIPANPIVVVAPASLDFGEVELTVNKTLNATVQNSGGGILEITGVDITNPNFSVLNTTFPVMLASGEQQVFEIQFHPSEPQPEEGTLTFLMDSAIPGNKTIALSGIGLRYGVLRESFEDLLFPPLGWKVIDNNADGEGWLRNVNKVPTGQVAPHTGIAAAGLDTYAGNIGQTSYDDWLITPKMVWQTGDVFQFWIKRLANQTGQVWRVKLSTTGTAINDFMTVDQITDPPMAYILKSYDLSQYGLSEGSEFYIAFQFNGVWCWPGVIDDVLGSVMIRFDNDLMALNFTGPDIIYANTSNNYQVLIGNYGKNPVQAGAYDVKICALVGGQEVVYASVPGVELTSGQTQTMTIPVNVPETGEYGLYAKIDWTEDEDLSNNTSSTLNLEVIHASIVVKNIGTFPLNQQTSYTYNYPISFEDYRGSSLHECLYYTNELNTGGIVTRLTYYTSFANPIPNRKVKVWMTETNMTNFETDAIPASDMHLVFDGVLNFSDGLGKININLTEPYVYTGSGNLAVLVYYYQGGSPYINENSKFAYEYVEYGQVRNVYDNWYTAIDPNNLSHVARLTDFPITSLMFETGNGLGSITGRVLYQSNSAPVEGAKIVIENPAFPGYVAEIYSNSQGYYTAPKALAGNNLKITISKYSYGDVVFENVNLAAGGSVNLGDAMLVPRPLISLSGSVILSDTQLPATGAVVKLHGIDNYQTTADDSGNFYFSQIWGSTTYQIEITLTGYQTYIADISVPEIPYLLDPITILELAPAPNLVNVTEGDLSTFVTWYAPGSPYPMEFRYDDGVLQGVLITTGSPDILVGSAWTKHASLQKVHWYTYQNPNYPYSPQVMITILGLTQANAPDPNNILFVKGNIENKPGWNTLNLSMPVETPNGFFIGISGYSNYTLIAYDDGVDEPYEWQPLRQWSNGMGSYQPLENVTSPPLHANIFIRASGLLYGDIDGDYVADGSFNIIDLNEGENHSFCITVEPEITVDPSAGTLHWNGSRSFQHYNVYRKLVSDDIWMKINQEPVYDTVYIDQNWANLTPGFYHYAVEAEYSNGVTSELSLSNEIEKLFIGIIPGDANCDGVVDVLDVITIGSYIIGLDPTPFCFLNADLNGDNQINLLDIIMTVDIILE
ncbi:MAG: choice-of-anchor D domain-containing protein [Bacteroidales bacterium]